MSVTEQLKAARVVAIFRGNYVGRWSEYVEALLSGGIVAMEITLNSTGALDGLRELKANFRDRIILGAGTVLTPEGAHQAIDAGATFIVAPDTDEAVITVCKQRSVAAIPGAFTPTEIKRAWKLGAALVKVFPAQTASYIKAVRAPLDQIPFMVTGGVSVENVAEYFAAGADAVGVGSFLTATNISLDEVAARAAKFTAAAHADQQPVG